MNFICENCGQIQEALMDGYFFGDRLMEDVMFVVTLDDSHKATVRISEKDADYFKQFNAEEWYKQGREFAEENDFFTCPKCQGECWPEDMDVDNSPAVPLKQIPMMGAGGLKKLIMDEEND